MPDPIARFRAWYAAAWKARVPEADAIAVATADAKGRPSVRVVFLKGIDARGFMFCTNTPSRKAREIKANPRASLVFYWRPVGRQVRVDGRVVEISRAEAVAEWMKRPRESRISSIASHQSQPLKSRGELMSRLRALVKKVAGREVLCPVTWTGFRVVPESIEFWERGEHRLHHRELFTRRGARWTRTLLNP